MKFKIHGKIWKYGDNVNTDEIIPARYLNISKASELVKHCFEDLDKNFVKKVKKGDVIVAGENFGCGSSREHAPLVIKEVGVACVIAKSFARIFYRNAINIGLPILESKEVVENLKKGDKIEVDIPFPPFMQDIIKAGGLMKWIGKNV